MIAQAADNENPNMDESRLLLSMELFLGKEGLGEEEEEDEGEEQLSGEIPTSSPLKRPSRDVRSVNYLLFSS